MRIGELSKQAGISVRAIRHYNEFGLLGASRGTNRYRTFTEDDTKSVQLIQLFLSVGFSLAEIRDHAPCWQAGTSTPLKAVSREDVIVFLQSKLSDLDKHIEALFAVRSR